MTQRKLSKTQSVVMKDVVRRLTKKFGAPLKADITRGVSAAVRVWDLKKDGTKAFGEFCERQFVAPGPERSRLLERLDSLLRTVHGSMGVVRKQARAGLDIADYQLTPAEELLGAFTVASHLSEDLRTFKIAALVQLNFGTDARDIPQTREGWALRRMAEWGRELIPAKLLSDYSATQSQVDKFVSGYNLYLDRIDFGDPDITFPAGTRVSSHWGLRDYMMSLEGTPNALKKQRAICSLLQRVVDGHIPLEALDNAEMTWNLPSSTITHGHKTRKVRGHGPARWEQFRKLYLIRRKIDPYTFYGNMIDSKFLEDRELEEQRVVQILTDIVSSDVAKGVGTYLSRMLGRPLEPFDIYFKRFTDGGNKSSLGYDMSQRFPTNKALQQAIPEILRTLGFSDPNAVFISSKIRVDNSRSAGHAWSPSALFDIQLLRVRIPKEGMNEIEFSVFMHELGHCVEGVLSTYKMDYGVMWGVPNTALTECFAFTFQDRADEMLGREHSRVTPAVMLQRFWEVYEIAGPALLEIEFFHWLYKHPKASPQQMHQEIRKIADRVWEKYYRPVFGCAGQGLFAVYSHILACDFYLADYPLGYVAAYQIRRFLKNKVLGQEMPRMCGIGRVYPDVWMQNAVGAPLSAEPLLEDVAAALRALDTKVQAA